MLRILTVCTGNICRSPLAAVVLAARAGGADVRFASAGTRAREGAPMTEEAIESAMERGVEAIDARAHRSRFLLPFHLQEVDLVLAMAREHRRAVVELEPSRLRMTFTARELARTMDGVSDDDLAAAASTGDPGLDPHRSRFSAMLALVRARRGLVPLPLEPDDDDVLDPFGRSRTTYRASAAQLDPGLAVVERLVRLAVRPTSRADER